MTQMGYEHLKDLSIKKLEEGIIPLRETPETKGFILLLLYNTTTRSSWQGLLLPWSGVITQLGYGHLEDISIRKLEEAVITFKYRHLEQKGFILLLKFHTVQEAIGRFSPW